jgi:hypothetical protein
MIAYNPTWYLRRRERRHKRQSQAVLFCKVINWSFLVTLILIVVFVIYEMATIGRSNKNSLEKFWYGIHTREILTSSSSCSSLFMQVAKDKLAIEDEIGIRNMNRWLQDGEGVVIRDNKLVPLKDIVFSMLVYRFDLKHDMGDDILGSVAYGLPGHEVFYDIYDFNDKKMTVIMKLLEHRTAQVQSDPSGSLKSSPG